MLILREFFIFVYWILELIIMRGLIMYFYKIVYLPIVSIVKV